MRHSQRCKLCKTNIERLLHKVYGDVLVDYPLDLPAQLEGYRHLPFFEDLSRIHHHLQEHRGFRGFTRVDRLPRVDYYCPRPGLVVELDESQHYTKPRKISLLYYPDGLNLGYDRTRWIELCTELNRHDNDPAYRDEQRAWYDTLRDFSALALGNQPTVRLYVRDEAWCALDADARADLERFSAYLTGQRR